MMSAPRGKLSWKSSASEDLMPHRSNASEDSMATTSAVRPPTATIQVQSDRKVRCPHRKFDGYVEKGITATQRLVGVGGLYKHLTPAIFKLLEFIEVLHKPKNTSKPTQVL